VNHLKRCGIEFFIEKCLFNLSCLNIGSHSPLVEGVWSMSLEVFSQAITIFGGILVFVLTTYWYDGYRKPKLGIVRVDPLFQQNITWWRIIVMNSGRTAAENCRGSIHLRGTDANGKNVDVQGSVCWSIIGNPDAVIINVKDEHGLELYRVEKVVQEGDMLIPNPIVAIPTEKGWDFIREKLPLQRFVSPAQLQIDIRITAKNADPLETTYTLREQNNDVIIIT
jgi:hypothetical protein